MKKVLLTAFTGFLAFSAIGQACTPDASYTPTSSIGAGISDLPCATINVPYDESATIVVPANLEYSGQNIAICKVTVDSITNIPTYQAGTLNTPIYYNGSSYGFGQAITLVPPTYRACVVVQGTFTQVFDDSLRAFGRIDAKVVAAGGTCASAGLPINNIAFTAFAPNGISIYFAVKNAGECTMGIEETISNNSFDVAQNYPNPFNGETQVLVNLPETGKFTFRVTNLVGKTVKEVNMNGNAGSNYININSADYAAGVYMYSVSFAGKTITKRMIIK